ncbi:MAG: M81 family metallopeptidase, partial [Thermomicrobiales bacterium]|nr:M81 family metallopeptidase [Thermomicrobiales bacterium]
MTGAGAPARNWRIGIGGMTTEGNTFAPLPTMLGDFETLRGPELLTRYPFMPDGVFPGWPEIAWLPALHADALPGGPVAAAAYTTLKREMLDRVRAMLPLDGFVLDLHGAMAVEGLDDAEADLAAALRDLVGPRCLISASMDLHGNVSARLVELVNLFTA